MELQPENVRYVDAGTQTLSTGDVAVTKLHFKEEQSKRKNVDVVAEEMIFAKNEHKKQKH